MVGLRSTAGPHVTTGPTEGMQLLSKELNTGRSQTCRTESRENRVVQLTVSEEGAFFYYLVLLIGAGLLGAYFWVVLMSITPGAVFNYILFVSGLLLVSSTYGLALAASRPGRVMLTVLSGLIGGVHGYLDLALFTDLMGIVMFAWVAFGLLLSFAALSWLRE